MSEAPKKPSLWGRLLGRGKTSEPDSKPEASPAPEAEEAAVTPAQVPVDVDAGETTNADAVAVPEAAAAEVVEAVEPERVGAPDPAGPAPVKQSWFQRLRSGLSKTSQKLAEGITSVFTKRKLDATTLDELEDLLIQADLGLETSMKIVEALGKGRYEKGIAPEDVRAVLAKEVEAVLAPVAKPLLIDRARKPHVVLVVGVNGTGKTTTIGKLANQYRGEGQKVMLAAGDTFRAAAIDQLKIWGERTGARVVARDVGADSAGLAFDALKAAREEGYDVLMMDTAGRLQNKQALMEELEKVIRVIRKVDQSAPHDVVLVLDATTGQNALNQVEVFREKAGVTGLVMTKLDGTARGGILVAISAKFKIPVHAIGVGEAVEDLQAFDAAEFARAIAMS